MVHTFKTIIYCKTSLEISTWKSRLVDIFMQGWLCAVMEGILHQAVKDWPSSTVALSCVTLSLRWSMRFCSWTERPNTTVASWDSSVNMSSACLLRLLSSRIMLARVLLVTHSSSLRTVLSTFTRLTLTGSIRRLVNGIVVGVVWNKWWLVKNYRWAFIFK